MSPNGGAPCSNRRPKFFAMKKAQSDLDVECDFSDLPPAEREAACKYEYMRESRALRSLRSAARDNLDKEFRHPHRRRIAPYLNRLSRLCTADCPRQYGFWRSEYRIYCFIVRMPLSCLATTGSKNCLPPRDDTTRAPLKAC